MYRNPVQVLAVRCAGQNKILLRVDLGKQTLTPDPRQSNLAPTTLRPMGKHFSLDSGLLWPHPGSAPAGQHKAAACSLPHKPIELTRDGAATRLT